MSVTEDCALCAGLHEPGQGLQDRLRFLCQVSGDSSGSDSLASCRATSRRDRADRASTPQAERTRSPGSCDLLE
ncbi:hypothetical protein SynRCC2555_02486 [Synechococcus sp. WH 8101]|nr:hypothetical protein SynRCC2555_02486 [Synechococcus sp. WH 8101]